MKRKHARRDVPNARFWTFWNDDYIKVTLKPGDSVMMTCGGEMDEGYSFTAKTYRHDGDHVTMLVDEFAKDCDGKCEWHSDYRARLDTLRDGNTPPTGLRRWDTPEVETVVYPRWREIERYQRDYTAESEGY